MFILIEDRAEIRRAQSQLEATLRREFSIKEVRDIGWQGGRRPAAKLHSNGEYWYWSQDHKNTSNPRRLNWFGRIYEGPGVAIAVEINIPYEGRNDSVAGFFAKHASSGQIYLFHSGRVGGGAKGVKKDAFVAWSDLQTHPVYARDGSQKEGLLVMPIAARGAALAAVAYVEAIIDFKAAVREGRTETTTAKEKEHQYRAYFDESFGRRKGRASARDIDYVSRHGEVVKSLSEWRQRKGLARNQQIVKSVLLDLGVSRGTELVEAYEVKTSTMRGDIYTGIGQLTVHAKRVDCLRTLVLPADESLATDLIAALKRNNIQLQRYRLTETGVTLL